MFENKQFVQVILPLHLEWEPWYYCECNLSVGQIVEVPIGRRKSLAVVSSVGLEPDVEESKILPVLSVPERYPLILEKQIRFWRFIADYYLCTCGDVFRYAYPAARFQAEERKAVKKLSVRSTATVEPDLYNEKPSRPLVIKGWNRSRYYEPYIRKTLSSGRDVLLIRPDAKGESAATLRELSKSLRSDTPVLVEGSKALLFLPFVKLGLVIVDDEHSARFKHNQSPRFNGRDAALMLASIHGAEVILGTLTPSLETVFNIRTGKYSFRDVSECCETQVILIDTDAERRKNGMKGPRSRILISAIGNNPDSKVLEIEARNLDNVLRTKKVERYGIVAVLNFDYLLSRNDFRSDEKAAQLLAELKYRCSGILYIQARNSAHRVLNTQADALVEALLTERKEFGLPPYTRLVEIRRPGYKTGFSADSAPVSFGGQEIVGQHFLKRDRTLQERKNRIRKETAPPLIVDVDPL